jgi:hypothetical protein
MTKRGRGRVDDVEKPDRRDNRARSIVVKWIALHRLYHVSVDPDTCSSDIWTGHTYIVCNCFCGGSIGNLVEV